MPSRILCPGCQAAFAYSPALLGKTVRCKTCQHTFTITAPPPEEAAPPAPQKAPAAPPPASSTSTPAAAGRALAPGAKAPGPPPLPPRAAADPGSKSGEAARASGSRPGVSAPKPADAGSKSGATRRPDPDDDDRPRVGRDDDDDDRDRDEDDDRPSRHKEAPRRRAAPPAERESGGPLLLIGMIAAFVVGFLILAAGIAYLLWPSSKPSPSDGVAVPAPAGEGMAAVEPPKNLDAILNEAPNAGGPVVAGPPPVGPPAFPNFDVPKFEPPPALKRPPRVGAGRPPPVDGIPAIPGRPAVPPKAALAAPRFAPVQPLAITPTPLATGRVERAMPSPVENMVVAGGGRLLLLHLPVARRIAVFDVSKGERVKLIPAEEGGTLVAGGMNVFVIYLPGKNVLERWSCQTLEREAELKDVFPAEVKALAMGSATNGPLVAALGGARRTVHGGATFGYFDPGTGKEVGYEVAGADNPFGLGIHNAAPHVRVSADGSVVVGWGENGQGGTQTDVLSGGRIARHWQFHWLDTVLPGPDGRTLYGKGVRYPPDMKADEKVREDHDNPVWLIPAVHGDAFVSLRAAPAERRGMPAPRPGVVEVCLGTEGKSILKINDLVNFEVPAGFFESRGKAFDHHLALVPEARVLAVVPTKSRDRLVLYRADLDAALARADFDFLFVSSRPPTAAVKGQTYRYTVAARSKKGGVKVSLESGPKGMTVTPAGAVAWDVPGDYADSEAGVILLVKDAGGSETFHSFRLSVRGQDKK